MPGASFVENIIGTNAIALSMRLKKPVYTVPLHHYCDLLKEFHIYAVPLNYKGVIIGYLAVFGLNDPIKIEHAIIIELTAYKIINEFNIQRSCSNLPVGEKYKLNRRQLEILKQLAMGIPDKIIALEGGITINTVKYHKKSIFKALDVECSIQAVVKCIKLNLLSIEEIKY